MKRKQQRQSARRPLRRLPRHRARPEHAERQLEAIAHLKAGRLDEAAAMLHLIVEGDPDDWQGLASARADRLSAGAIGKGRRLIRRCLDVHPNLAEGYSDLGVVLKEMGEFDDAQAACEKAIALKPAFHPAFYNLGNIFKADGTP